MNVRLVAGAAILALVFAGIFVASAADMGVLATAAIFAGSFALAAAVITGVILLAEGWRSR